MRTIMYIPKKLWVKRLFKKAGHNICSKFNWECPIVLVWDTSVTWDKLNDGLHISFLYRIGDKGFEVSITDYCTNRRIVSQVSPKIFKYKSFLYELESQLLMLLLSRDEYEECGES